jgi:hypothetical protein
MGIRAVWAGLLALVLAACGRAAPLHVSQVAVAPGTGVAALFGPASPFLAPVLPTGLSLFAGGASASADGRWLAYQAPALQSWDIFLLDTATGQINALANLNSPGAEIHPVISADGATITFLSDRNGFLDAFMYDRVTKTYRPLTFSYFAAFGLPLGTGRAW